MVVEWDGEGAQIKTKMDLAMMELAWMVARMSENGREWWRMVENGRE